MPDDLKALLDGGLWNDCTERQRAVVVEAWMHDPLIFERKLVTVLQAENPTARLVWQSKRILAGPSRTEAQTTIRRPHDEFACNDCGDTGFVVLTRTISPEAIAGDAAPCHCPTGQQKLHKSNPYRGAGGTPVNLPSAIHVNYGPDDFEPAVVETPPISLLEYAQTPEGRADPNMNPRILDSLRRVWKEREQRETTD